MVRGLSRTVLKLTLPGVPDLFQGTEFWDLSLVDPDNRRPVDYAARAQALAAETNVAALLDGWQDGRIKQRLIAALLADRAAAPRLYAEGDYRPLMVQGARAADLVGFSRNDRTETRLVLVTRMVGSELPLQSLPIGPHWRGTTLPDVTGEWEDILTGARIAGGEGGLELSEAFAGLPVAVLRKR
jgi:(1->4)-alpha-D-glucan 1-alpha-D-glucosylmutase